jgi:hypothetical protein
VQEVHKEIKVREERREYQEIEENKVNKENRDIWVLLVK